MALVAPKRCIRHFFNSTSVSETIEVISLTAAAANVSLNGGLPGPLDVLATFVPGIDDELPVTEVERLVDVGVFCCKLKVNMP